MVNDEGALRETIEKVIADNPQSVEDYHNGKKKAMGFLVGQTMKAMKGKANPAMVNAILTGTSCLGWPGSFEESASVAGRV